MQTVIPVVAPSSSQLPGIVVCFVGAAGQASLVRLSMQEGPNCHLTNLKQRINQSGFCSNLCGRVWTHLSMLGMQTHPRLRQLPSVLQKGTHIHTKKESKLRLTCVRSRIYLDGTFSSSKLLLHPISFVSSVLPWYHLDILHRRRQVSMSIYEELQWNMDLLSTYVSKSTNLTDYRIIVSIYVFYHVVSNEYFPKTSRNEPYCKR